MLTVTQGHKVSCALEFLDQHSNPMLTPPTPDGPPKWSVPDGAVVAITPSGDGLSCDVATNSVGTATVTVNAVVDGNAFVATLDINVQAEPQVLTSIGIKATVS